jgi:lysylphosphatidylglycerol synthetase-like protein (DUF2156 family)
MMAWYKWLLPDTDDVLKRGRAGLVIATCLGLIVAIVALLLIWVISGELESDTPLAAAVLIALLMGIGALARVGRVSLAMWMLVILLTLLITADAAFYGVGSVSASGYILPIVLAACGIGLMAGLGVAAVASLIAWLLAWGEVAGWYTPALPPASYHLTLNAPVLTVLFLLVALIAGAWTRRLSRALAMLSGRR